MFEELKLVEEFHKKFKVPILNSPQIPDIKRFNLRFELIDEEVKEYLEGCQKHDIENVAKEIADILYGVYGTILEHGLQDKFEDVFKEVHRSHMTKDYSEGKMIKGESFQKANIKDII